MKKLLSIYLVLFFALTLVGCVNNAADVEVEEEEITEDVVTETEESIEDNYTWLQLENGSCIARDPETGMFYAENEIGELAVYVPDFPVISDPSILNLPAEITPYGETKSFEPVWLDQNGYPVARNADTGMLYAGNEAGIYAPYVPDLVHCENK